MDLQTLSLVHDILESRSIRKTARTQGLAPSTLSGALARFEAALATTVVRREGTALVLTLEAERRLPHLAAIRQQTDMLRGLTGCGAVPPVSLAMLTRFGHVVQAGSIRRAAAVAGIGQPQLTRQMAGLEQGLGQPLLVRGATGVGVTETGRALLPVFDAILSAWESLSQEAARRGQRARPAWQIGTVVPLGHESGIAGMLAHLIEDWAPHQARHPLVISSHMADELLAGLKARRFDLIVLDHPHVPRDFHSLTVSTTPLALVGPHALFDSGADPATLLGRYPLALPRLRSGIRQEAMRYLERLLGAEASRRLRIVEIDSIPVIIRLLAHGEYLSVLPEASLLRLPYAFGRVTLPPEHVQHLVIAWRRSGLPQALLDSLHRAALAAHGKPFDITHM